MAPKRYVILILGGGVAGLTTAMALTRFSSVVLQPTIDIFEIRSEPGTVGGAVNLTPNALRLLDYLGVLPIIRRRKYGVEINAVEVFSIYHPNKLTESSFRGPNDAGIGSPPYKALRITRANLVEALIEAVRAIPTVGLHFGKRAYSIDETSSSVKVRFSDRSTATGDILLGCDGVHSFTRNHHVEPSRKQIYTGVSNAFGFVPLSGEPVHFEGSALNFARRGLLLTSYYEHTKTSGYVGAIVATPDVGSRHGWKAKGSDCAAVRADMLDRFGDSVLPANRAFIEKAEDWFMWPVYMLPPGGKWATTRTMLLGDAAHGMPPQGESTGIVLEDTILFARCLMSGQLMCGNESIKDAFDAYERLRRERINHAFTESQSVVSNVQDCGWLGHTLKTWSIPIALKLGRKHREKHFTEDVTKSPLGFGDGVETKATKLMPKDMWSWMRSSWMTLGSWKSFWVGLGSLFRR